MALDQHGVRKDILRTMNENPYMSHRDIGKKLGIGKTTVSRVVKHFKDRLTLELKEGSGRKKGPVCAKNHKKVVDAFKRKPNSSVRDVARKTRVSKSYVQKTKVRAGLKTYKVQKAPNRNEQQNTVAKAWARKLYTKLLTKATCCVMDDETYVKADFLQLPGQQFFTARNKFDVPEEMRKQKLSKFAKKFLIWQAICSCGRRSVLFITQGTMNADIYKKECLQKRLLPFLKSHSVPSLFWPDLASCHYAKDVLNWYNLNDIDFVPRELNPPNTPELRPIEKYWALMKQELRKHPKIVKNEADLKMAWMKMQKIVGTEVVQNLMEGVKRKVREFGYGEDVL